MYLGVVSRIITELNDQSAENYTVISLCDKENNIKRIYLKNDNKLKIGDLLFVKIDKNEFCNIEKISDLFFVKDSRLDEIFLFQLFNLINKVFADSKKVSDMQVSFSNLSYKDIAFQLVSRDFVYFAKNIKLNSNDIKTYSEIQCMKIIMETRTLSFDFEKWINSVALILCLSNNNDISEELLTRAIEALLNVKIANNETNELKLQLEQQLKEKLNQLKGNQKKLV